MAEPLCRSHVHRPASTVRGQCGHVVRNQPSSGKRARTTVPWLVVSILECPADRADAVQPRSCSTRERGRHGLDRLQRRDLQPRRDPAAARGGRPPLPTRGPTPRRSSTPTSSGATPASSASAACSRSRSGTRSGSGCCWRATGWASSRSTGRVPADRLLFGSEIKAILESGLVDARGQRTRRCPSCSSTRYLSGAETLFKGIYRLLPGHTLVFEHGAVDDAAVVGRAGRHGASARSRAAVGRRGRRRSSARGSRTPVRTRLMADVPLGMFLSGGLDSSAIAALMARHDRSAAADLLGRVQGAGVQRARLRAPGRDRDQGRRARDRHRRAGLLRRAAAARLARGRADRASLERAALLRLEAGARARQGRPHRRRQRRAAGRLRQVSARAGQLARRRVSGASRRSRSAHFVSDTLVPRLPGRVGALRAGGRSSPCRARRRRCSSTTSRRSGCARQALAARSARCAALRHARTPTAPSRAYFDAPNGQQHARSTGCSTRT